METTSDRYRKVAAGFTERVRNVPEYAWDNPAPCEGWVARDVVRHLVEWMPAQFFGSIGATGQDETLDADEVHLLLQGMEPMDDALRQSGHYGPRVESPLIPANKRS